MPTLLQIDSSPLGNDASFSRSLTADFVRSWQKAYAGTVLTRDLAAAPLFPLNAEWIAAAYTPEPQRTDAQKQVLGLSDELIAELQSADEIVIGVPMHNFSIPGTLKLWVDQVVRAGRTFSYGSGGPKGLLAGKRATLILATGGNYETGTHMAAFDFVEPYLRALLGFIGIEEVRIIRASGTASARDAVSREALLGNVRAAIEVVLQAA